MSYKVTKANESYTFTAPAHFDARTTRLHDPHDVNEGRLICGLSHFLPAGGIEKGANPNESIYYIIEGEMTVTIDGNDIKLQKGDSIHFGPDTERSIKNSGISSCQMLMVILPAQKLDLH